MRLLLSLLCAVALGVAVFGALSVSRQQPLVVQQASTATPSPWDKPQLAPGYQTVALSESNRNLTLNSGTDYVLTCANPVNTTWGLVVYGGHNVILQGCNYESSGFSYGAQFKNQTGTLWLSDVHFGGPQLSEGIDLQEPTANVVFRGVLIDEVHGSQSTNHADCVQTWAGPVNFRIDGFTCTTDYQGFLMFPNQNGGSVGTVEGIYDFRHVDLTGVAVNGVNPANLGYFGWVGSDGKSTVDFKLDHFYETGPGEPKNFPNWEQWADVISGSPPVPGGHYVIPESWGAAGPDSPGGTPASQGAGESPVP